MAAARGLRLSGVPAEPARAQRPVLSGHGAGKADRGGGYAGAVQDRDRPRNRGLLLGVRPSRGCVVRKPGGGAVRPGAAVDHHHLYQPALFLVQDRLSGAAADLFHPRLLPHRRGVASGHGGAAGVRLRLRQPALFHYHPYDLRRPVDGHAWFYLSAHVPPGPGPRFRRSRAVGGFVHRCFGHSGPQRAGGTNLRRPRPRPGHLFRRPRHLPRIRARRARQDARAVGGDAAEHRRRHFLRSSGGAGVRPLRLLPGARAGVPGLRRRLRLLPDPHLGPLFARGLCPLRHPRGLDPAPHRPHVRAAEGAVVPDRRLRRHAVPGRPGRRRGRRGGRRKS